MGFSNSRLLVACLVGLSLCWYAYVVETTKEHNESYEAMCDISEHMSCSKAFLSPYGKGFGLVRFIAGEDSIFNIPNPIYGAVLYTLVAVLSFFPSPGSARIQLGLCIAANLGSVYLACILYFVLRDFCVVCVSTYIVNAVLLYLTWSQNKRLVTEVSCAPLSSTSADESKKYD